LTLVRIRNPFDSGPLDSIQFDSTLITTMPSLKTTTSEGDGKSIKTHKSKKEKPLNETPEERELRKKEKKDRKERKERKRLEKEQKESTTKVATTKTTTARKPKSSSKSGESTSASVNSSPTSVVPEYASLTPAEHAMPSLKTVKAKAPASKPKRVATPPNDKAQPKPKPKRVAAPLNSEAKAEAAATDSSSQVPAAKASEKESSRKVTQVKKTATRKPTTKSSSAKPSSTNKSSSAMSKASIQSDESTQVTAPAAYALTEQRPVYPAHEQRQLMNQQQQQPPQREQQQQQEQQVLHQQAHAHAQPMSESDMSSYCSSAANSDHVPNITVEYRAAQARSSRNGHGNFNHGTTTGSISTNEDHMSVSVMTDPLFGQAKHNMDMNTMTMNQHANANRQYQEYQKQYEMQQQYQYQMQQQQQQQQQAQQQQHQQHHGGNKQYNTDTDYNEAMFRATSNNSYNEQAAMHSLLQEQQQQQRGGGAPGAAQMDRSHNPEYHQGMHHNHSSNFSTTGSVTTSASVMMDAATVGTEMSRATQQTVEVSIQQQKFLLRMVKTLSRKLKKADDKIRRLNGTNAAMQELAVNLTKSEEQLEYASEENNEFAARVRALEQALLMQETELDQALALIRKNDQEKRKRESLEAEQETNPFAGKQVDEQLQMREELAAVRDELDILQSERDKAVDKATKLSIQLAELRAESDEFRDQLSECHAMIEHLRNSNHHSSSSSVGGSKRGFFWNKKDEKNKSGTSSNDDDVVDDEVVDTTEENTSVSSDDCWNGGSDTEDMTHQERRRHEEASMELTL
jgi:hypothetical protein